MDYLGKTPEASLDHRGAAAMMGVGGNGVMTASPGGNQGSYLGGVQRWSVWGGVKRGISKFWGSIQAFTVVFKFRV